MTAGLGGRIPASLQAIFTASNKGEEVYVPPADNSAFKIYGLSSKDQKKPILIKYASSSGFKKTFAAVSSRERDLLSRSIEGTHSLTIVAPFPKTTGTSPSQVPHETQRTWLLSAQLCLEALGISQRSDRTSIGELRVENFASRETERCGRIPQNARGGPIPQRLQ